MPPVKNDFNQQKQKALELVKSRYNESRSANLLDFERFSRYYKLFRNKQTNKNYYGLANLFVPEPYRIIRKKTAKLANAIKKVSVTAEGPNDVQPAKTGTQLLNFLRNKLNWHITERVAIQESRIVGLSWLKVIWNLDKEETEKPYRGFDLTFATADQIFLNSDATILDVFNGDLKWLIHEYETDYATLLKNPNYKKSDLDLLKLRSGTKIEKNPLADARIMNEAKPERRDNKKRSFRIFEYWGRYGEEDGEEKDYLIVVADNVIVLRFEENSYRDILDNPIPFVPFVANAIGKELYPVGDIEPSESLFNELNDTRNQRMDTVTLNIDPAKEVLRAAQIEEKELIARRGWVIHSNIPNGVRFISPDMQGVKAAIEEETVIRGDIQQTTGVLDFAPGSNVQAGVEIDTARGALIAKGEADVLIEDEINMLKLCLKMLYRIVLAYAQNFLDREFIIRVVENGAEQFLAVSKESIQGNFDLDIEMKTLQDKTTDQQLNLLLFNQAKTVPGAKLGKFFTDVLESFREKVAISEYYEEPAPQQETPKVSISLRGELNPAEVDEIYKLTGADPTAADPLLRQEFREAMRGNLPEHQAIQETQSAETQPV